MNRKRVPTFEDWIERFGAVRLADRLGVTVHTVLHWRSGRCDPRVDAMRVIKKMSGGEIGYEQMIDRTPRARANRIASGGKRT